MKILCPNRPFVFSFNGKEKLTLIICVFLFSFLIPNAGVAQVNIEATLSADEINVGDVIEIRLETDEADGLFFLGTEIIFSSSAFSLAGSQPGSLLDLSIADLISPGRVGASAVSIGDAASGAGTLLILQFNVLADASGTENIFTFENPDVRDQNGEPLDTIFPESVLVVVEPLEAVRPVRFSVNMNVQENAGNFNPDTDLVRVAGAFNEWSTTSGSVFNLSQTGSSGVYEGTFQVEGEPADELEYKFIFVRGSTVFWESDDTGPGENGNRILELGPISEQQILPTVFFSNLGEDDPFRDVTFTVNMAVQKDLGFWQPDSGDQLFVYGSFNDWSNLNELQAIGDQFYATTLSLPGDAGAAEQFRYRIVSGDERVLPNDGFEILDEDRELILPPANQGIELLPVFFGDRASIYQLALLEGPGELEVHENKEFSVGSAVQIDLFTDSNSPSPQISAWIGFSSENTNPASWPSSAWIASDFSEATNNLHRYVLTQEADFEPGIYYYAARFQFTDKEFVYGGFSADGGGFWDGSENISGVLTVIGGSSAGNEPGEFPTEIKLDQNYPNPFNPTTTISFALPESSPVLLQVFNMQGQLITTLADRSKEAGVHRIQFDASALASGIYIYRLSTNGMQHSRKMTLVK
ncbi:MAG: T9SS type A sorting domain-containing protein [Balneolales bacterium]|nr:T9SS type A sorting domain-containing protein [Balneolales bacterium]